MHVCLHAAHHHRFSMGLLPLLDVRHLVESGNGRWNWSAMIDEWRRDGILPWMAMTLDLAREFLGVAVPASVVGDYAGPEWERLKALTIDVVLRSGHARLPPTIERLAATSSPRKRGHALWQRLTSHYRPAHAGIRGLRERLGRVAYDARTKLPRYASLWKAGTLRPRLVGAATEQLKKQEEIAGFLESLKRRR